MAAGVRAVLLFALFVGQICFNEAESESVMSNSRATQVDEEYAAQTIQLVISSDQTIATVGDYFICATLDWWPPTKCNYGTCPWFNASLLNLDLENPILGRAVTALAPLKLRLGGTLQDLIVYDIGSPSEPCLPIVVNNSAVLGFNGGCLSMQRWDVLNQFFKNSGVSVAFGLNILYGRRNANESWNSTNAADFIRYTHDQGYPVTEWELGNEVLGVDGVGWQIYPDLYAEDMKELRAIVDTVYQYDITKPLVVAPDSFYDVNNPDYQQLLSSSGPQVVDVITRHIYNLGPGLTSTDDLVNKILSSIYANDEEDRYRGLQTVLSNCPWANAWVGEAGGAYNSGHGNVTDSFIMAFWYLDQLGLASKYNNQAFCRQTLIGGHYGLLDAISFVPNPDFYGALLWKNLMGSGVLSVDVGNSTGIRAYAHCQKDSTQGGVTLLVLNYNNDTSYHVVVSFAQGNLGVYPSATPRLEYHMAPEGDDILSHVVVLNGIPLQLTSSGDIPPLQPDLVDSYKPITLDPLTYAYVVFQNASGDACLQY